MRTPQVHLLLRRYDFDSLPPALYGSDPAKRVMRLATALATNPSLAQMGPATFVVRQEPEPALAIIGEFDRDDEARLGALQHAIQTVLPTARYITYETAEAACRGLAARLIERVGAARVRHSRFVAIPRGGHVVLGILSYLLDLEGAKEEDGPLIVIDDSSISGNRFRQFLDDLDGEDEIVFAHLYSTPQLREAIERADARVLCVSGNDLRDLAPERLGPDHSAWLERWRDRTGETAYWLGQPEHIVFPWNEPDSSFWNPATDREERGWSLAPPDRCLKNDRQPLADLFVLPNLVDGVQPHPESMWARIGENVIVGDLESGSVVSLDGAGADMWEALVSRGSEEAVIEEMSALYNADSARLRNDVTEFVADLRRRGLVV